jgi:hypothetical protein
LRTRTCFRRYRGRLVPISCLASKLVFDGTKGTGSRFQIFAAGHIFGGIEGVGSLFMFCAPRLVFGGTKGVWSRFHVLRPNSFSAVRRASGLVFMFCALILIFNGTNGVVSRFPIFRARTRVRRYRGRQIPFSNFALPDSFSAVPRASLPVFNFCAPGLVLGGSEGVGSRFHVLHARTLFRR